MTFALLSNLQEPNTVVRCRLERWRNRSPVFRKTEFPMMSSLRRTAAALLVLGVIASAAAPPAVAQTYPTKPVQLVVAFPPGGVGDIVARAVSDRLARALGQSVHLENRPGSAGLIGTNSA